MKEPLEKKGRNNFTRLSYEVQRLVIRMLAENREYDEIRKDKVVSAELTEKNLQLHSSTFLAVRRSRDYLDYKRKREETEDRVGHYRRAAEALKDAAGISSVADMAQMALLEQLRELSEKPGCDVSDLLKLANAITKIKDSSNAGTVSELRRELRLAKEELFDSKKEVETLKLHFQAAESEYKAEIALLRNGMKSKGVSEKTISEIEEKIGLL